MTLIVFAGLGIAILAAVGIILFDSNNKKKGPKRSITQTAEKKSLLNKTQWLGMFRKVDSFFLTRSSLRKIHKQVKQMSVFNAPESRIKAIQIWITVTSIEVVAIVTAVIIFKNVVMILLVFLFIIIIKDGLIMKQVDKVHFQVLKDLSNALSNLRQAYMSTESVSDAIAQAEVSKLLQGPFSDIHLILTSTKGEELLEEFYTNTPFKLLNTLASISYKLDGMGDTRLADGSSSYLMSLNMINADVLLEIRRLTQQKLMFGSLEYMPVAPLAAIPLIESFFATNIPGTAVIFNGFLGYLAQIIIILASITGYMVITRMNSAVAIKKDDRNGLTSKLLTKKWFKKIVRDVMPKSTKRLVKANNVLRSSLSTKDMRHLYGDKVIFSTITLVVCIIVLLVSLSLAKDYIYNNISNAGLVSGAVLTEKQAIDRRAMDDAYMALPAQLEGEVLEAHVKKFEPWTKSMGVQEQMDRLTKKYDDYHGTYFKYWHLIIIVFITIISWFSPNMLLVYRRKLTKAEASEDVLQLQTVISILMFCDTDTLETLEWMQRQSDIHKNLLIDCYHEYPSNPEIALQRLKSKVSTEEFRRMVDKLSLTVHRISLLEAFGDLLYERDHILRIKEMTQDKALSDKRQLAKPLAMSPVYLVMGLYFIFPIGYLGAMEFINSLSQMDF